MFLAILFILIGILLLLNALGVIVGNFWGFIWAVIFLAIGFKLMMKKGVCPVCGWGMWQKSMHGKIHEKMHGHCCDEEHEEQE